MRSSHRSASISGVNQDGWRGSQTMPLSEFAQEAIGYASLKGQAWRKLDQQWAACGP